jgi:hypothetical protein
LKYGLCIGSSVRGCIDRPEAEILAKEVVAHGRRRLLIYSISLRRNPVNREMAKKGSQTGSRAVRNFANSSGARIPILRPFLAGSLKESTFANGSVSNSFHSPVGIGKRVLCSKSSNLPITIRYSFLCGCLAFEITTFPLPGWSPLNHVPLLSVGGVQFLPVEESRLRVSCHSTFRIARTDMKRRVFYARLRPELPFLSYFHGSSRCFKFESSALDLV